MHTKSCQTQRNVIYMTRGGRLVCPNRVEGGGWIHRYGLSLNVKVCSRHGLVGSFQSALRWGLWWRWRVFWRRWPAVARQSKDQGSCSSRSRFPRGFIQGQNYQACINPEHDLFKVQRQGRKGGLRPVLSLLQWSRNQAHYTPDGSNGSADTVSLRRLRRARRDD